MLEISYTIDLNEPDIYCDDRSVIRSDALLRAWDTGHKPLIWLEPQSSFDLSRINPSFKGADFAAVHTPERGFSTALLYFGRSRAAHELLKHWNLLCAEFPHLPADFVLDMAWGMITAQRPLVTRWLSAQFCQPIVANVQTNPVAPSTIATASIEFRNAELRQARSAARTGAPEPQYIMNAHPGSGGATITFVTAADGYSARKVATLMEDAAEAFGRHNGAFSSLAFVICRDAHEATNVISLSGNNWVIFAWPGASIDPKMFSQLVPLMESPRISYVGLETCPPLRGSAGKHFSVKKSQMIFGPADCYANLVRDRQRRPLVAVK